MVAKTNETTEARQKQADRLRAVLKGAGAYPTASGVAAASVDREGTRRALAEVLPELGPADEFAVMVVALSLHNTR